MNTATNGIDRPGERGKLLFLVPLCPLPVTSGTQARAVGLLQRLARRFEVTLLTLVPPSAAAPRVALQSLCARVIAVVPDNKRGLVHRLAFKLLYWSRRAFLAEDADRFYTMMPSVVRALRRELRAQTYDVVVSVYWYWQPWRHGTFGLHVVDTNDVQWERGASLLSRSRNPLERALARFLSRRWRRREVAALRRADVIVSTTVRDRDVFVSHCRTQATHLVVPTGIDTDFFAPRSDLAEPRHVVFYGALRNPVNVDAVEHLVGDILPRLRRLCPDVRLTLVGSSPPPRLRALARSDGRIHVTGTVDDVREPLARAALVVLPLRRAQGIRGRVFEVFSMAVPLVATTAAVRGMGLESGDGLLLADGADAFAAAVARLLADPNWRRQLGQRGRELALSRYSLAVTYDPLVECLAARVDAARRLPVQPASS